MIGIIFLFLLGADTGVSVAIFQVIFIICYPQNPTVRLSSIK